MSVVRLHEMKECEARMAERVERLERAVYSSPAEGDQEVIDVPQIYTVEYVPEEDPDDPGYSVVCLAAYHGYWDNAFYDFNDESWSVSGDPMHEGQPTHWMYHPEV